MMKKTQQQNIYTAIMFQGVSVNVLQITARSQKEAKKKLLTAHSRLSEDKVLKIDDIMEHQSDWSFALFDATKIKFI